MKDEKITKAGVLKKLYSDGYMDVKTLWHLLPLKFSKFEIEEIDKTFRQYKKDTK